MRLLLYAWNANNEQILADNLIKLGVEIVWFRKECKHYTRDMELAMEMIQVIRAEGAEGVISFNYFPIISMICNTCQIPYYAWVYDCPHFTLYAKQIMLPCNHIGIFDKDITEHLRAYGVQTVYHVPLAADTEYFTSAIQGTTQAEQTKYDCDISFVGSLYTDEHNYYDAMISEISGQNQEAIPWQEEMNQLIVRQCFAYQEDYLQSAIVQGTVSVSEMQDYMEKQGLLLGEDYFASPEEILKAAVLEKKVTVEERRIFLEKIGEMVKDNPTVRFRFYTGSDTKNLPLLQPYNRGRVDYQTQMPLVFSRSKINLNLSLRSIHSGIPLRVLDIMACGGFVLTNWQPEIEEYFVENEEIVLFHNLEEGMEKIRYYLQHEEERQQIAKNGQKKVQEVFSYQTGLAALF